MSYYIYSHDDADGLSAAYQIYEAVGGKVFPLDYGINIDVSFIKTNDTVYIVDFSFKPNKMSDLLSKTKKVIWIDHHKSAFEKLKEFDFVAGIRDPNLCGSALTYLYLKKMGKGIKKLNFSVNSYQKKLSYILRLIDDFDRGIYQYPETRQFAIMLKNNITGKFDWTFWNNLFRDEKYLIQFISKGKTQQKKNETKSELWLKKNAFIIDFEGYNTLVCPLVSEKISHTEMMKSVENDFDLLISYFFNQKIKKYKVSISSKKIKVRNIAEKMGGGGHDYASGWVSNDEPFKHITRKKFEYFEYKDRLEIFEGMI